MRVILFQIFISSVDMRICVSVQIFSYTVPLWVFLSLAIIVFLLLWLVVKVAVRYFLYIVLVILLLLVLETLGVFTWLQAHLSGLG